MKRDNKGRFIKKYNRKQELIKCSCGCGKKLWRLDNSNRVREFILGHYVKINPTFKGKHHTEKTKIRISKIKLKRHLVPKSAFKKGSIPWNKELKGKYKLPKLSKKRKEEISNHFKKLWKNKEYRELKTKQNKLNRSKQIFPFKDTSIEIKIQNFLSKLHIEYYTHKYISEISHSYQCDIFLPVQKGIKQKTIIECDGCFFHCCPICKKKKYEWTLENKKKDKIRTKELIRKGFRVLRLWGHEIKVMDSIELSNRLQGGVEL